MIDIHNISTHCTRTEFVGTTVLDTIGLVISGIDDTLLSTMNISTKYHTLGLFSSRTGAAGQITAIDDAGKATNTEVLSIEFPRDTRSNSHLNSRKKMPESCTSATPDILNLHFPPAQAQPCKKLSTLYRDRLSASWQDPLLRSVSSWLTPQ